MTKQLKLFIAFIFALFSTSIGAVESLQELCTNQLAQGFVSDAMLEQFRNNPDFIQGMKLNNELKDLIKTAIISSYRPTANALRLNDWIVSILRTSSTITPAINISTPSVAWSVAWSPDGKCIAAGLNNGTTKIWAVQSGTTLLHTLTGHNSAVHSTNWSPDGRFIATGSSDQTTKIWNVQTGTLLHTLADNCSIDSVTWSSDGSYITTVSSKCTAKIWDTLNGFFLNTLPGKKFITSAAVYSPNRRYLATGLIDETARIFYLQNDTLLNKLIGHSSTVLSVAWSPDGTNIATTSIDCTAKIWDPLNGVLLSTLIGHEDTVIAAVWSPDQNRIVTTSYDKTIKIWNLPQLSELSLDQTLFLALVYHDHNNNQSVRLGAPHKYPCAIYHKLPVYIQNSIRDRIII